MEIGSQEVFAEGNSPGILFFSTHKARFQPVLSGTQSGQPQRESHRAYIEGIVLYREDQEYSAQ